MAFMDPFEGHSALREEFSTNMVFLEDGVGLDMLEVAIPTTPEKPASDITHLEDGLLNFTPDDGLLNFMNEFGLSNFAGDDMLLNFMEGDDLSGDVMNVAEEVIGMAGNNASVRADELNMAHDGVDMPEDVDVSSTCNTTGMVENGDIDVANVVQDVSSVVDGVSLPTDDLGMAGIMASDVGSLLEQFEEVSQAFADETSSTPDVFDEIMPVATVEDRSTADILVDMSEPSLTVFEEVELHTTVEPLVKSESVAAITETIPPNISTEKLTTSAPEVKMVTDASLAPSLPTKTTKPTRDDKLLMSTLTVPMFEETKTVTAGGKVSSTPTIPGSRPTKSVLAAKLAMLDKITAEQEVTDKNGNFIKEIEPEDNCLERLQKLKSSIKRKTTVMLPMGVPAKRGRGRALARGHPVPMPANCAPLRLQRVMMQNKELRDSIPLVEPEVDLKKNAKADKTNLDDNFFELANDHDYCTNGTNIGHQPGAGGHLQDSNNNNSSIDTFTDVEDGEVLEEVKCDKFKVVGEQQQQNKRSYRKQHGSPAPDPTPYFDKLPSYYTALSIQKKSINKSASNVTLTSNNSVHDFIERDASPVRDLSTYNKLPDYHSTFTNSTKYDEYNTAYNERVCDFSLESKISSGYSSRSESPLVIDSRVVSRSQSVSSAGSRSSSASSCSQCSCSSHSRSRSRESGSRGSPGRPRSLSRSRSRSSSRSHSACSRYSRSSDRGWKRDRNSRRNRHKRQTRSHYKHSRSRSRSYSRPRERSKHDGYSRHRRSPSYYSRSRSRHYRSRSRDYRSRSRVYRSRSRSIYRSRSRSWSRGYESGSRRRSHRRAEHRKRSESQKRHLEQKEREQKEEKNKQNKQRRIMYVGNLPDNHTRRKLRQRFERFGEIEHIQLHFREHGDNYGFVTFAYTCDAYAAIEKGNSIEGEMRFDLCFGGRRQFCDLDYADLDGNKEVEEEYEVAAPSANPLDFDQMLRQAQKKLKR